MWYKLRKTGLSSSVVCLVCFLFLNRDSISQHEILRGKLLGWTFQKVSAGRKTRWKSKYNYKVKSANKAL